MDIWKNLEIGKSGIPCELCPIFPVRRYFLQIPPFSAASPPLKNSEGVTASLEAAVPGKRSSATGDFRWLRGDGCVRWRPRSSGASAISILSTGSLPTTVRTIEINRGHPVSRCCFCLLVPAPGSPTAATCWIPGRAWKGCRWDRRFPKLQTLLFCSCRILCERSQERSRENRCLKRRCHPTR